MIQIRRMLQNAILVVTVLVICMFVIEVLSAVFITSGIKNSGQIEEIGSSRHLRLKLHPASMDSVWYPTDDYLSRTNRTLEQKEYRFRTDSYQSLTSAKRGEPTLNSNNLFFVGGSTTETQYVGEELRWPLLTAALLSEATNEDWTGYNYGVGGNNLVHSTVNYFAYRRIIAPRVLIIHNLINDLTMLSLHGSYLADMHPQKSFFVETNMDEDWSLFAALEFLKEEVFNDTYLAARMAWPNAGNFARQLLGKERTNNLVRLERFDDIGFLKSIWAHYEDQLDELLSLAEADGVIPVVLLQAVNEHYRILPVHSPEKRHELDQLLIAHKWLNNKLEDKLLAANLHFVDLRPLGDPANMYDDVHYNEVGSIAVANRLSKYLAEMLASGTKDQTLQ